jgi:hypothetical protein
VFVGRILHALMAGSVMLSALPGRGGAQAAAQGSLTAFANQRVIVVPVQGIRFDSGGAVPGSDALRRSLDDALAAAIAATGIGKGWGYAAEVVRSAKRNVMYTGDPYALGAQALGRSTVKPGEQLSELFASNLRPLLALGDARFALIPVQVVLERVGQGIRARLRLVMVDGRASQVLVTRELVGSAAAGISDPVLFSSLTALVAASIAPE